MDRLVEFNYTKPNPWIKARYEGILRTELDDCGEVYQQIQSQILNPQ